MYKSIVLHERRPELTHADFMTHWLKVHAPMSEGARDLYGYVCNEVIEDLTPSSAPHARLEASVDGIAQMWFKIPDGLQKLPSQQSVKAWFGDGPNFIGRRVRFVGEEQVLVPPRRLDGATPKLFLILARAQEIDSAAFRSGIDAAIRLLTPSRYGWIGVTLSHILASHPTASIAGFPMSDIDSVLEVWTSERNSARAAARTLWDVIDAWPASLRISGIRALATMENVIRRPAD